MAEGEQQQLRHLEYLLTDILSVLIALAALALAVCVYMLAYSFEPFRVYGIPFWAALIAYYGSHRVLVRGSKSGKG